MLSMRRIGSCRSTNTASFASSSVSVVSVGSSDCTQRRSIIDSTIGANMNPLQMADKVRDITFMQRLRGGVAYQRERKLWPSTERLERHMTKTAFPLAMGRDELGMLPMPADARQRLLGTDADEGLVVEGPGGRKLLESVQLELEAMRGDGHGASSRGKHTPPTPEMQRSDNSNNKSGASSSSSRRFAFADDDPDFMEAEMMRIRQENGGGSGDNNNTTPNHNKEVSSSATSSSTDQPSSSQHQLNSGAEEDSSIRSKMILNRDGLEGSMLASFGNAKEALLEELLGDRVGSKDEGGNALWDAIPGLHPLLAERAAKVIGPTATRTQHRLLSALLHEDHNDVLMSSPTGAGKTWSLLLAALNGVHSEDTGVNILVAGSAQSALRMASMAHALMGEYGGTIAGRDRKDRSWLQVNVNIEDNAQFYKDIITSPMRRGAYAAGGTSGVRLLIVTTNVLTDLFFTHLLQFETLGYLRRMYVDDIGQQLQMLRPDAPTALLKERHAAPRTVEQLLATIHQLPGPHIRSLIQLGLVGNDVDTRTKSHLNNLCIKQAANTIILTPHRIPSSLHVTYSFFSTFGQRFDPSVDNDPALVYAKEFIFNARHTIPGRAVIFVPNTADLYQCRSQLRRMGMDVKTLSEVRGADLLPNGEVEWKQGWKFLILKEQDSIGLSLPLVSHVFTTYAPANRQALASMAAVATNVGSVGWMTVLCNRSLAPHVRVVAEELSLPFTENVVTKELTAVPTADADRMSRQPTPLGMDPQMILKEHYLMQTDLKGGGVFDREIFGSNNRRHIWEKEMFQMDYEPLNHKERRHKNAKRLDKDLAFNPSLVLDLQKHKMVDEKLKPTFKLRKTLTLAKHDAKSKGIYSEHIKGSREQRN